MMRTLLVLFLLTMVCACKSNSSPIPTQPSSSEVASVDSLPSTPQYSFTVKAWVNYLDQTGEKRVILMGSLLKEGVYLGGIMMHASWPDQIHHAWEPNCVAPVLYGKGVCPIDTSSFASGVFVPITVTFEYQDTTFVGHTGFTP